MRRINALLVLSLISCPTSFAEDKKETRSLADDAASLVEKSGKTGWVSEEVTVTQKVDKTKVKARLQMTFKTVEKGKPSGTVALGLDLGRMGFILPNAEFELLEKDGKRHLKILGPKPGEKLAALGVKQEVLATLEYSIKMDELTVTGGVIHNWLSSQLDIARPISFKRSGK